MITLGIIVYNREQLEKTAELIKEYLQDSPSSAIKQRDQICWTIPFLNIILMIYNPSIRGYRFDAVYYDEHIPYNELQEVVCPRLKYTPRPLAWLLSSIKN